MRREGARSGACRSSSFFIRHPPQSRSIPTVTLVKNVKKVLVEVVVHHPAVREQEEARAGGEAVEAVEVAGTAGGPPFGRFGSHPCRLVGPWTALTPHSHPHDAAEEEGCHGEQVEPAIRCALKFCPGEFGLWQYRFLQGRLFHGLMCLLGRLCVCGDGTRRRRRNRRVCWGQRVNGAGS